MEIEESRTDPGMLNMELGRGKGFDYGHDL
jgi:hypothetical protein